MTDRSGNISTEAGDEPRLGPAREASRTASDYRSALFNSYDRRTAQLEKDVSSKLDWFARYSRAYYLPSLDSLPRQTAAILDLGCSRGYLLAVLRAAGFADLHGVDLSPGDIAEARKLVPEASLHCGDALSYLKGRPASFDALLTKAVLEHVPKSEVIPLLKAMRSSIRDQGVVIVDVPNMDWLFAGHERYMDMTHEGGFTKESLRQVLEEVFPTIEVRAADNIAMGAPPPFKTQLARGVLGTLLRWADPEGGTNPIWERSLVAICRA